MSHEKSILFILVTLTAVGVYGVSNLIDTNVPPTGFPSSLFAVEKEKPYATSLLSKEKNNSIST